MIRRSAVRSWLLIIATVLFLSFLFWWQFMPKLGSEVTRQGLLALRPGMSEAEVIYWIGEPLFKRRKHGYHPIGDDPIWNGEWSWIYGEQGFFDFGPGFEISVGMKGGRLVAAGAERFDLGIWWCNQKACPVVWDKDQFEALPGN